MKELNRAKILFQKYLERTATQEEVDEMFVLLRDKNRFHSLHGLFESEWESKDVELNWKDMSWAKMQAELESRNVDKTTTVVSTSSNIRTLIWRWTAAASVLIVVGLSAWMYFSGGDEVYTTGFGETQEIILSDNSRVTLNANSKMTWKKDWQSTGQREVVLEGEAYFEVNRMSVSGREVFVEQGKLIPFTVRTPDLLVNVHGTAFNVQTRRKKTDVYLQSGKVLLTLNDESKSDQVEIAPDSIYMAPGDWVSYSGEAKELVAENHKTVDDQASWIQGSLYFENEELGIVLQQLSDIYGKEFEVGDSTLLRRKVDLGLPYADWETVSGLMKLSLELKMQEKGNKIIME